MILKKLLGTIIIFGLFASSSMSEEYLATDIVAGYSWRYLQSEQTSGISLNRIIDYTIDSVWGKPSDTLFFRISEHDSVNHKSSTIDTVYTQNSRIVCRKINRVTECDSSSIAEMFSEHANISYDSLYPNLNRSFSNPIDIAFNQEQFAGLLFGSISSGVGTHMGSSSDSTIFSAHLGLLKKRHIYNSAYPGGSSSYSFTLLSYNGKNVLYTFGNTSVLARKPANSSVPVIYLMSYSRNNFNPGYTLLGRLGAFPTNVIGMRILKLPR